MVANPFEIKGPYSSGHGKAHESIESQPRQDMIASCLGGNMIGTFNVTVDRGEFCKIVHGLKGKKGYWYYKNVIIPVTYYLCYVTHKSGESRAAWALYWRPLPKEFKRIEKYSMELISRSPIPDKFKDGSVLTVSVYDTWSKQEVDSWWPGALKRWFQSYDWGPQRADDLLVWNTMYKWVDWRKATVLDVGCNTGWYSFAAAQHGASVYGYDTNPTFIDICKKIAGHIEYKDVSFGLSDPGGNFKAIFYLSVHHYVDPDYSKLGKTIEAYKKRCRHLFVELLSPPPGYPTVSRQDITAKVGGTEMLTYEHEVRGTRTVWRVDGYLE